MPWKAQGSNECSKRMEPNINLGHIEEVCKLHMKRKGKLKNQKQEINLIYEKRMLQKKVMSYDPKSPKAMFD